jgi:hypothetical protein
MIIKNIKIIMKIMKLKVLIQTNQNKLLLVYQVYNNKIQMVIKGNMVYKHYIKILFFTMVLKLIHNIYHKTMI